MHMMKSGKVHFHLGIGTARTLSKGIVRSAIPFIHDALFSEEKLDFKASVQREIIRDFTVNVSGSHAQTDVANAKGRYTKSIRTWGCRRQCLTAFTSNRRNCGGPCNGARSDVNKGRIVRQRAL